MKFIVFLEGHTVYYGRSVQARQGGMNEMEIVQ